MCFDLTLDEIRPKPSSMGGKVNLAPRVRQSPEQKIALDPQPRPLQDLKHTPMQALHLIGFEDLE